jgi:Kdo2-lipid IVA lauroyltransferase/acyltransferase
MAKYRPKFILEYALLRAIAFLATRLPYRAALCVAWTVAGLGMLVLRRRMSRFKQRLRAVLGATITDREIRRILRRAWRNLCFGITDLLRTPVVTRDWVRKAYSGSFETTWKELAGEGRGIVVALPHMGSWEMAGIAASRLGISTFVITRDQKNPLSNAYMKRMREVAGLEAMNVTAGAFLGAIRRLKKGMTLAILPDIRAKTDSITVDFLGGRAEIPKGMALFAKSAGVPILPVCLTREGWTRHRWDAYEPIWPDASLDRDADVLRMTQYVMTKLNDAVLRNPDQYFWFNKRWILGKEE